MSDVAVPTPKPTERNRGDLAVGTIAHIVLIVWSLIVIAPLVWTFLSSFKNSTEILQFPLRMPENWGLRNYRTAWNDEKFGSYFINTIIVVGSALVLVMLLGAMCAYVLARFKFPFNRVIYYLMLACLTFPVFLAIVPLFQLVGTLGIRNTLPGLIAVYVAFALPFTVFFLYPFFRRLPDEISEAAAVDGAGEWRTFFQVMLPMAKPGLASVAIFNFLGLWNQFLLPVALNTSQSNYVLSQGMSRFASSAGYAVNFGALFAAVMITVLPVLAVYVIFQRQLAGSVSQGTMK